jgi:hypothetical protein
MAFNRDGLYLVTPAVPAGHRIWKYTTLDALTDVDGSGYFNSASKELAIGDIIIAVTVAGTVKTPTGYTAGADKAGLAIVNGNSAGVVDITDFTDIATADGD